MTVWSLRGSDGSQTRATEAISLVALKMQTEIASLGSETLGSETLGPAAFALNDGPDVSFTYHPSAGGFGCSQERSGENQRPHRPGAHGLLCAKSILDKADWFGLK
ncbi:MAG: hypothetical protein C4532_00435 [Candidatus Abyssobacteria bacterium SURF_17]|uniref:Uncharacterized protein n=1 Tax=Candidatus Abyssobacteria bacterium SURF_17 TaxID=2093361 RepID=A0A419F9M4_9BACT|nr:MAG: hypothetical protein C4532_00435 [Candidatus Abyssubacteria bacterium SURF_17]